MTAAPALTSREVVGLGLVATLVPLNSTMIVVALGDIGDSFDVSKGSASVLVVIYLVVMLVGQPAAGRFADVVGAPRLLAGALVGFATMSLVAPFASSFVVLVGLRVLHAAFAAPFLPLTDTLVRTSSPDEQRGRNFGILGSLIGVGAAAGPVLGGVVTDVSGWQGVFVVNVPVLVAAGVLIAPRLRATAPPAPSASEPETDPNPAFGAPFRWAFAAQAGTVFGQYSLLLVVPIVLDSRGWAPSGVGLALSAMTAGLIVMGPLGGRIGDRTGRRRPILLGIAVATVGVALTAGAIDAHGALIVAALLLYGVGAGLALPSLRAAALDPVPLAVVGRAAGVMSMSRYAGSIPATVLIAVLVTDTGGRAATSLLVATAVTLAAFLTATRLT